MQPRHRRGITASPFVLKDRSNQQLLDGAKHLVGRHRIVTAHLVAHLAEIYARKLHVVEGFSYLGDYCVSALGMSEDEANRRAHAAVLARKYPVILDMLLEGSIHLTTLRIVGKCLTQQNHLQVLNAARGKNKTQLEHLAAALCPKPDVPTVLRKLPEPKLENVPSDEALFAGGKVEDVVAAQGQASDGAEILTAAQGQPPSGADTSPDQAGVRGTPVLEPPVPRIRKSRLAPLSPRRYNLQVTVDEETYHALKQLQDLLRHQVRNGDLGRIIKDAVLERLERVKREKFGHTKRTRKAREQESWIEVETAATGVRAVEIETSSRGGRDRQKELKDEEEKAGSAAIAPGRLAVNSRHIPAAVKREVWERDKGRCAFVGRTGRRCSEKGKLEFHHIHAYALGGPATVDNIALRCRTHNAHESAVLFGRNEKKWNRPVAIAVSGSEESARDQGAGSIRPGANAVSGSEESARDQMAGSIRPVTMKTGCPPKNRSKVCGDHGVVSR